jgi:hypothetical protein
MQNAVDRIVALLNGIVGWILLNWNVGWIMLNGIVGRILLNGIVDWILLNGNVVPALLNSVHFEIHLGEFREKLNNETKIMLLGEKVFERFVAYGEIFSAKNCYKICGSIHCSNLFTTLITSFLLRTCFFA